MAPHCTLFPDYKWGTCCKRHDKRYENTRITKNQADILLFRCVKRLCCKNIAYIIYIGVKLFGSYWYIKAQRDTNANKYLQ